MCGSTPHSGSRRSRRRIEETSGGPGKFPIFFRVLFPSAQDFDGVSCYGSAHGGRAAEGAPDFDMAAAARLLLSTRRLQVTANLLTLATIGLIHLLAVMSPGPSFLIAARTAVARSRADGI